MQEKYWTLTHMFEPSKCPPGSIIALLLTGSGGQMQFISAGNLRGAALPPGWFFIIPAPPNLEIIESEFIPTQPASEMEPAVQPRADA